MMDLKQELMIKKINPTPYLFSRKLELGKGTFGQVYLGFDEKNSIPVAVKMISLQKLHQSHSNQEVLAQKLTSEMINMQIAVSKYLVKLIDTQKSSKNLYLICQFCNESSLKVYMEMKKYFSENEALHIFKQILEGFSCLHEKKIVHRDLKPANILMHNHSIKIGDFGFSKAIDMHEQLLTSIVGSPLYMSPQILNNSAYTQKTDIWSLGIILYEMLYGEAPWKVSSIQDIKQKVKMKVELPKNVEVSAKTKKLIHSMLEYEQKNRMSWEQLFAEYLHSGGSEMVEENEVFDQEITQLLDYFNTSLSIQNENHLIHILESNNRPFCDDIASKKSANELFIHIKEQKEREKSLNLIFSEIVTARNRVSYSIKLMVQIYDYIEDEKKKMHNSLQLATIFLLLKMAISTITEMLNWDLTDRENFVHFQKSSVSVNIEQLLLYDSQILNRFYLLFMEHYFLPKIKQAEKIGSMRQMVENLQNFFSNEPGSSKFLNFWLRNYSRTLFNQIRKKNQISQSEYFISRMIYELDRCEIFSIFKFSGIRSMLSWKIDNWRSDKKWIHKLKEVKEMETESVASFISKEVKWNPLSQYDLSFMTDK